MAISGEQFITWFHGWLWPFLRISAVLLAAPIFGARGVPVRVRIGLAVAITSVVVPLIDDVSNIAPASAQGIILAIQQVTLGLLIGLTLRMVFIAFEVAGHVISQLMGLSFASMIDPQNGTQVPVISQFYIIMATLVFLSLDGHLILIKMLVESFSSIPITETIVTRNDLWQIINWAGWLFSAAVLIALPSVAAMMVVNLSFGVMTRAAPQLNIFAVGFPLMIGIGFIVMLVSLPTTMPQIIKIIEAGFNILRHIILRS